MEPIDLRQKPTTIWIKKGTKDELDSYGSRKDSYDDIIKKLLIENSQLKQKMEQLQQSLPKAKNILSITENKRMEMTISLGDSLFLTFSYAPPPQIIDESYRINIHFNYIQARSKKIKPGDYYKNPSERLKHYLRSVEAVIKTQINPLFKIDEERLFDIQEWKRLFANNGLSNTAFKSDIVDEFIKSGMIV